MSEKLISLLTECWVIMTCIRSMLPISADTASGIKDDPESPSKTRFKAFYTCSLEECYESEKMACIFKRIWLYEY